MPPSRPSRVTALLLVAATLAGCAGVTAQQYRGTQPEFLLEDYFNGRVEAWGMFQDRSGEVRRRFEVTIDGRMDGDTLVLDERFRYADGERDRRVWRLKRIDEHHYEGRAGDVIGVARGSRYGNAFHWHYTVRLPVGDTTYKVDFDDWMYRLDGGVVINRAEVTKWGFHVGEVTLFFRKPEQGE